MRLYLVAAVIGLAGIAMLAGAAVIANRTETTPVVATRSDRGGEVWGANYFPNTPLVTQDGERVRFFDDLIKDKVVAISFMYTSCPDTCPVETARMLQVARLLGDRLGKDVFFYSITIDPERDTQEALKAFTDSWNIPDGWTFLTGDRDEIIHLRKKLGMRLDDVASGELADHTVNMLIGNQKTGVWLKRAPFENAYYLANQLGSWLHDFKVPNPKNLDYADAPELRPISDGEYVFRNRCSACHTIGGGDVHNLADQQIGPDLFDVTRQRDREWLERWLAEPDAMLAEKDPVALALYERYNRLPMPNMRLTDKDVTSLLGYMERESQRIRDVRSGKMVDHSQHGGHAGAMDMGHAMQHAGDDEGQAEPEDRSEHAGHTGEG
jgi:cytochrome oxidase Cu insertion factor (SCO1/SenC/PrrC family)